MTNETKGHQTMHQDNDNNAKSSDLNSFKHFASLLMKENPDLWSAYVLQEEKYNSLDRATLIAMIRIATNEYSDLTREGVLEFLSKFRINYREENGLP